MIKNKKAVDQPLENESEAVKEDTEVLTQAATRIYCGPEIPGIARQFAIFKGELPVPLKEHAEKCPAINKLLVTPDRLQETRSKLNNKGTAENVFYSRIIEYRGRS